ncbi:MAG: iron-sulfur cluster assembly accessory protein [Alphaproteobacteria bacterium]|nr:iron-sulfur cluster assembly accessory protein [Alphaproteobacteria bacterium]
MADGVATMERPALAISPGAVKRIRTMQERGDAAPGTVFRITVSGGGCSGFQYGFSFDEKLPASDDVVFEAEGVRVVVDEVSLELVKGSELSYIEDLVGSFFKMTNPNAKSSCGCGTSFSI